MEYSLREKQKIEAVKRMTILKILDDYINKFVYQDQIRVWMNTGFNYWDEEKQEYDDRQFGCSYKFNEKEKEIVRRFEEENKGFLVYQMALDEYDDTRDVIYRIYFIGNNNEFWEHDLNDIKYDKVVYVGIYNLDKDRFDGFDYWTLDRRIVWNYGSVICVEVDDDLTGLAGFDYGKYIYETQIEPHASKKGLNVVFFSEKIEMFATSFIEGLLSVEVERGNKNFLLDRFKFKAGDRNITDRFLEHIK